MAHSHTILYFSKHPGAPFLQRYLEAYTQFTAHTDNLYSMAMSYESRKKLEKQQQVQRIPFGALRPISRVNTGVSTSGNASSEDNGGHVVTEEDLVRATGAHDSTKGTLSRQCRGVDNISLSHRQRQRQRQRQRLGWPEVGSGEVETMEVPHEHQGGGSVKGLADKIEPADQMNVMAPDDQTKFTAAFDEAVEPGTHCAAQTHVNNTIRAGSKSMECEHKKMPQLLPPLSLSLSSHGVQSSTSRGGDSDAPSVEPPGAVPVVRLEAKPNVR